MSKGGAQGPRWWFPLSRGSKQWEGVPGFGCVWEPQPREAVSSWHGMAGAKHRLQGWGRAEGGRHDACRCALPHAPGRVCKVRCTCTCCFPGATQNRRCALVVVPLQEWLRRVHDERASLSAALAQLMSIPKYGNAYGETVAHLAAYNGATDAAAIQRLQSNVMRERVLLVLAAEVFCCYILNDVQWARAIVHSYPVG